MYNIRKTSYVFKNIKKELFQFLIYELHKLKKIFFYNKIIIKITQGIGDCDQNIK